MPELDGKILYIVDDEADFRSYVRAVAQSMSWTVIECSNGQEFVDIVAKQRHPGVVLLDMMMPQLDGIETVHRIAEFGVDMEVFLITGGSSVYTLAARQIAEAASLRIRQILTKPIRKRELEAILSDVDPT